MDFHYHYNFAAETTLTEWKQISNDGKKICLETSVTSPGGEFVALYDVWLTVFSINGVKPEKSDRSLYVSRQSARIPVVIKLKPGKNTVSVEADPDPVTPENFVLNLVPCFSTVARVKSFSKSVVAPKDTPLSEEKKLDTTGFTPGAGHRCTPGRFGFTKGDGLLDCAVTAFGVIDKMYLCGHPRYNKPFRWGYCVLPGEERATRTFGECGIENDKIKINQLSVNWRSQNVSLTYSLASPGIITECESQSMRLSELQFAGNYQYVLTASSVSSLDAFTPEMMTENWFLLFGSTEFPDVPLLVVLEKKPENIQVEYLKNGRLSSMTFSGCHRMTTATPFGMESFDPLSATDANFLADAGKRCHFWSRTFLAFPVECAEYFKNVHATKTCHIAQKFSFRVLKDEWGTHSLKIASIPPAAALSGVVEFPNPVTDLEFPTKYGPLLGGRGEGCSYTLPQMPLDVRFPLRDEKSDIPEILTDGLKEYFDFQAAFPDDWRPYCYVGSTLERYGFAGQLFHFMPDEYRDRLAELTGKSLRSTCDPNGEYVSLLTNHRELNRLKEHTHAQTIEYYFNPDLPRQQMSNYYLRKEPFTGESYLICYLNVTLMRDKYFKNASKETINSYARPYVENDWGLGISLYQMYLSVLVSGDSSAVRENWQTIKDMSKYLDVYHDWACMASGYSEAGNIWVEGANYGAYMAYVNLAEIVGDQEAVEYGTYLAAQELALRLAIYRASQNYFHRFFDEEPYWIAKAFREEEFPSSQFQGFPTNLAEDRLCPQRLHAQLTEGVYPEIFRHFRQFVSEEHPQIMTRYLQQTLKSERPSSFWLRELSPTMILMDLASDPDYPEEELRKNFATASDHGKMIGAWRDIGTFSTCHPKNLYPSMILATLEMRKHQLWLEHWEDLRILRAEWRDGTAEIHFERTGAHPKLRCGVRKQPISASEKFTVPESGKIQFEPSEVQVISINFN